MSMLVETPKLTPTIKSKFVTQVGFWLYLSRPLNWAFMPFCFVLGWSNAPSQVNWLFVLQLFSLSFPLQLFLNGFNDIFDRESDARNPRKLDPKSLHGKVLPKEKIWLVGKVSGLAGLFVFLVSLITFNWFNILSILAGLFVGFFYTAPPIQFKRLPALDLLVYPVGFLFSYFAGFSFGGDLGDVTTRPWILSIVTISIALVSFVMDIEPDTISGQHTTATRLGARSSLVLASLGFAFVAWFLPFSTQAVFVYFATSSLILFLTAIVPTAQNTKLACYCLFIGFILAILVKLFL